MVVKQRLVAGGIGELHLGQARSQAVGRQIVQGVPVDLGDSSTKIAPDEILVAFELCLDHNEGKVGSRIHVARHLLHLFDLGLDVPIDALEQPVCRPAACVMPG